MKRLYIVRHGQTEFNVARKYAGQSETPLTKQGKKDAQAAGIACRELTIDYIFSSPLDRAYSTAKIIAEEIDFPVESIVLEPLLMEQSYGHFEGQSWDLELDDSPDVETIEAVINRAELVLEKIKKLDADTVLIVSHGTFAKVIKYVLDPNTQVIDHNAETELRNGEIFQLI